MRHLLWPVGVVVAFGLGLAAASLYPDPQSTTPASEDWERWSAASGCRSARSRRGCASSEARAAAGQRSATWDRPPRRSRRGPSADPRPPAASTDRRAGPERATGRHSAGGSPGRPRLAGPRWCGPRPSPRRPWTARWTASTGTSTRARGRRDRRGGARGESWRREPEGHGRGGHRGPRPRAGGGHQQRGAARGRPGLLGQRKTRGRSPS